MYRHLTNIDEYKIFQERRTRVSLISPDIPTRFLGKNALDSVPNQFVLFDSTSASKDAAQTTVPYIDAQEIKPSSGVWLTGLGLYHKGTIGYGGFVGFMVQTLDFSNHLLPEIQVESGPTHARLVQYRDFQYDFSIHDNL